MTDNVVLGAMTAGALVVTVLVACYTLLWQGIRDWETGLVLTFVSVGILALMDPLVINWLQLLAPKGVPATEQFCAQLSSWQRALAMGVYSIPFFAAFCTVRIAEWDWKLAQWIYRLPLTKSEVQTKMAAFTQSAGRKAYARVVFVSIAALLLVRIADFVNPVACTPMP